MTSKWLVRSAVVGVVVASVAIAVARAGRASLADAAVSSPLQPVLVELFTSEGCSSCPPADELLLTLATKQPVPGVRVIALGEHVDYWDRLGWRDHYSSAELTARQSDYSRALKQPDIYTPQMIVNGQREVLGSDQAAATAAIIASARSTLGQVNVSITRPPRAGAESVTVRVEPISLGAFAADFDVMLALTEDGLVTKVGAGENAGHTLRHAAVVRTLEPIGTIRRGASSWFATRPIRVAAGWKRTELTVVAFVQNHATRQIAGVDAIRE